MDRWQPGSTLIGNRARSVTISLSASRRIRSFASDCGRITGNSEVWDEDGPRFGMEVGF
jgi:hypothetical protein